MWFFLRIWGFIYHDKDIYQVFTMYIYYACASRGPVGSEVHVLIKLCKNTRNAF